MNKKTSQLTMMLLLSFITLHCQAQAQDQDEVDYNLVDIMSEMSLSDLLNIEITTAGKKAEKISEIPASVVVLGRQEIRDHGYRTLEEILESVPGLYAINDFAFNDVVFGVRGFWSSGAKNLIILVNGVRQVESYGSSYLIRNIPVPVEAIDRIEVVRGPMTVLYGAGAFFGAINIITDGSLNKSPNIVTAGIGSRDSKKVFLRRSEFGENYSYAFNASLLDSRGMNESYSRFTNSVISGLPSSTENQLENSEKYFNFAGKHEGWSLDMHLIENAREQFFFGPSGGDGFLNRVTRASVAIGKGAELSNQVSYSSQYTYVK